MRPSTYIILSLPLDERLIFNDIIFDTNHSPLFVNSKKHDETPGENTRKQKN